MAIPQPPPISANNRGPGVNLAVWISFVASTLAVLTKVASGVQRRRGHLFSGGRWLDDLYMIIAWLFGLGQSIAVSRQVAYGLGRPQSIVVLRGDLHLFEKSEYTAEILYVGSMAFSQLTALAFIQTLAVAQRPRQATTATIAACYVWAVVSIFAIAFQCGVPRPWAIVTGQCFNQTAFWATMTAVNVLIELSLIVLPVYIVAKLQTETLRKVMIQGLFVIRFINIALVIVRAVWIGKANDDRDNFTLISWVTAVITTLSMDTAMILSCAIFLKPVLLQIQSGWSQSNIYTGLGYTTQVKTNEIPDMRGYPMGSVIRGEARPNIRSGTGRSVMGSGRAASTVAETRTESRQALSDPLSKQPLSEQPTPSEGGFKLRTDDALSEVDI